MGNQMKNILFTLLLIVLINSCSLPTISVKATKPLISSTFSQILNESDIVIARSAIEAHLKLLEGILAHRPEDLELLKYAAMGYTAYTLAYVEDDSVPLAIEFYSRATNYAFQGLTKFGLTPQIIDGDLVVLENKLHKLPPKSVDLLFWGSLSWSLASFLTLDNPNSLNNLTKAELMMKQVYKLDSTYFYGSPSMYFAILSGYRPKILGGDPDKAFRLFENCRKVSNNQFLLERVFRARYLYVPLLEEDKFTQELEYVLEAPMDILPNGKLVTAIAKVKAKNYLKRKGDWF